MSVKEFFESLTQGLHGSAGAKAVYDDPIETQGKTVIPVAKVAYGFGGGYGETKKDKKDGSGREGGGAGGGIVVKPLGVVEITEKETRFIPLGNGKKLAGALILGFVLGFLFGRR